MSSGETLWEVASATRPDGVDDMNRLMVTLLRMNPDAFYQDNINALKRGAVLRIPSAAEVNAISLADARDAVRQQNEIWRGYQERAAGTATALADAGGSRPGTAAGSSAADSRLELVPPRAASGDQGGADRPGSGGLDASSSALREVRADLARTEEDLASARQEARELRSRVSDLEKIKTDQDRLLTLRDSELAAMQARIAELERLAEAAAAAATAAGAEPVAALTPAPDPVSQPEPALTPDDSSVSAQDIWGAPDDDTVTAPTDVDDVAAADDMAAQDDPSQVDPMVDDSTTEPVAQDSTTPAVTQPVPDSVATRPEPVTPPDPAKAWYQNYYLLGGAAAAVLALLGLAATRRRKSAADEGFDTREESDDAVDFGIPASTAPHAAADDGDFLYELQSRLSADPADLDAHLQLLRHLYAQGDEAGFEHAAQAMLPHVDDQSGPEWSEARSLGEALLPGNPLFAAPDNFGFDATSFDDSPTAESEAPGTADDGLSFDDFDEPAATVEVPAPTAASSEGEPEALDFDFDFDSPTQVIEPVKPVAEEPSAGLGFDSPTDAEQSDSDSALTGSAAAQADFGASLDQSSAEHERAQSESDELGLSSMDFDFSLDSEVKKPEVVGLADSSGGLDDDLSFELEPAAPAPLEAVPPAAVAVDQDQDDFLDLDFGSLGESDAVGTKLDLARAYIDMGDPEGARSMLEEVIAEGNSGQRSDAEKLMAGLG